VPPLKAAVRAYGQVYEGIVINDKRKKALIQYRISPKGALHNTLFTKRMNEADFRASTQNGVCFIYPPGGTRPPKEATLKADPDSLALRPATQGPAYPEGSARQRRVTLLQMSAVLSAEINSCKHCKDLRDQRAKLHDEADSLLLTAADESEVRPISIRRVVTKKRTSE
jgi:hypothetical protein